MAANQIYAGPIASTGFSNSTSNTGSSTSVDISLAIEDLSVVAGGVAPKTITLEVFWNEYRDGDGGISITGGGENFQIIGGDFYNGQPVPVVLEVFYGADYDNSSTCSTPCGSLFELLGIRVFSPLPNGSETVYVNEINFRVQSDIVGLESPQWLLLSTDAVDYESNNIKSLTFGAGLEQGGIYSVN